MDTSTKFLAIYAVEWFVVTWLTIVLLLQLIDLHWPLVFYISILVVKWVQIVYPNRINPGDLDNCMCCGLYYSFPVTSLFQGYPLYSMATVKYSSSQVYQKSTHEDLNSLQVQNTSVSLEYCSHFRWGLCYAASFKRFLYGFSDAASHWGIGWGSFSQAMGIFSSSHAGSTSLHLPRLASSIVILICSQLRKRPCQVTLDVVYKRWTVSSRFATENLVGADWRLTWKFT